MLYYTAKAGFYSCDTAGQKGRNKRMKYRMLLVEDDDRIREIVEDYFSAHKNIPGAGNPGEEDEITVISAKDGDEGLV